MLPVRFPVDMRRRRTGGFFILFLARSYGMCYHKNANTEMERKTMVFICYPKCTTCQKARKWLDEHKIAYELRDIKTANPACDELAAWHETGCWSNARCWSATILSSSDLKRPSGSVL